MDELPYYNISEKDKFMNFIYNHIDKNGTRLKFDNKFNGPFYPNCIPKTVTTVIFGKEFNQPLITIDENNFVERLLPDSVTCLEFIDGSKYNQPLIINNIKVLPNSITKLVLSSRFNQPLIVSNIPVLPCFLEILSFGSYYRYYSLSDFNQPLSVDDVRAIPDTLHSLYFSYLYTPILEGELSNSLRNFNVGHTELQKEDIVLPYTIERVNITNYFVYGKKYILSCPMIKSAII